MAMVSLFAFPRVFLLLTTAPLQACKPSDKFSGNPLDWIWEQHVCFACEDECQGKYEFRPEHHMAAHCGYDDGLPMARCYDIYRSQSYICPSIQPWLNNNSHLVDWEPGLFLCHRLRKLRSNYSILIILSFSITAWDYAPICGAIHQRLPTIII